MVLHKCTAANKLILSLKEIISTGRADSPYPKWSDHFLLFCEHTADATLKYIEKKSSTLRTKDDDRVIFLSRLSSIIQGWELLHTFIKPVLDADALKVPYPLIHFLSEHIGKLNVVKDAKLVIEIIPALNYLQHRHTRLKNTMKFMRIDTQGPYIEPRLGFLGMPCSQSKSLFMNCLLYHEVGHFIAEEAGVFSTKELDKVTEQFKDFFKQYASWAAEVVLVWMEELFADLVAVKLLGPAYTLSYLELLRLVTDLSHEQMQTFEIDHPADALRFREQLKILKDDKWVKYIKNLNQWKELEKIAAIKKKQYRPPYEDDPDMLKIWQKLMEFLCDDERIKNVHEKVSNLTSDRENPRKHYAESFKIIQECLQHGIVPSVSKNEHMPHPTAIINGAVFFWLSGMSELYQIIPKISGNKVKDRAFLEARLEMWCLKAIEDWLIERNQKRETS